MAGTTSGVYPATTDFKELSARYEELQRRVTRFSVVEQALVLARDRLDREVARFSRMHRFIASALQVQDRPSFLTTVAEALVDVFEAELGIIWMAEEGVLEDAGWGSSPGLAPAEVRAAGRWALALLDGQVRVRPVLLGWRQPAAEPGLNLVQALTFDVRSTDGSRTAILLAGITERGAALHEPLTEESVESFTLFAQLVAALMENRRGQETIRRQVQDIQRSEAQHKLARAQAEAANRAKTSFLANTSHELRTPMNGVLGTLQLLQDLGLSAPQAELVRTAEHSARALLQLLNDILDLSKVEAGKVVLEARPFDLGLVLHEVAALFEPSASQKGLALGISCDPSLPASAVGDAGRLRQVLVNLMGNALKFTLAGRIDLEAARTAHKAQPALQVRIRDTGIGMTPEELGRLFAPFVQADPSTTRRFGGTGLGLAISRNLVQLMGGALTVESSPGQGTTFSVVLPLVECPPEARPPAPVEGGQKRLSGKVLVVEDNAVSRLVARKMVERLGLQARVVEDGLQALEALDQERFDLVLMDCQMPNLDGLGATAELRRREHQRGTAPVRVVALTASAQQEDRAACLAAGMDDFLSKPLQSGPLLAMLSHWIPGGATGG